MNDQTQRIVRIMQDKKMSPTQFSDTIGIKRAAMSHITSGRNNPSADVLTRISERFVEINPGWLLTGKGTMKLEPEKPEKPDQSNGIIDDMQPDLFNNRISAKIEVSDAVLNDTTHNTSKNLKLSSSDEVLRKDNYATSDNRYGETVNQTENVSKPIDKEIIIYKERPVKTIDKIVIFFSDQTYETFITEKTDVK